MTKCPSSECEHVPKNVEPLSLDSTSTPASYHTFWIQGLTGRSKTGSCGLSRSSAKHGRLTALVLRITSSAETAKSNSNSRNRVKRRAFVLYMHPYMMSIIKPETIRVTYSITEKRNPMHERWPPPKVRMWLNAPGMLCTVSGRSSQRSGLAGYVRTSDNVCGIERT